MKPNDWRFLTETLEACGFKSCEPLNPGEPLDIKVARANGIPDDDALEWLAGLFQILPLDPARMACSSPAEAAFRVLAVSTDDPEPWVPMGTVGPLLICAHYNPACSEFWKIPGEFVIPVVIPRAKYDALRRDVMDRLAVKPLEQREPLRLASPVPAGGSVEAILDWLLAAYPFDDPDILNKVEQDRNRLADAQPAELLALKNVPRGIVLAVYHLATGDHAFNPEYAPPQAIFPEALLEKHGVYPMYSSEKVVYLLSSERQNFAFEDEWMAAGNGVRDFRPIYADRDSILSVITRDRGRAAVVSAAAPEGEMTHSDVANLVEIDIEDVQRINPSSMSATPEQIVHWVLYRAITGRASDLHLEKYYNTARFRARIDGELKVLHSCPEEMLMRFIALIKNYSNMGQRRQDAQDARFSLLLGKRRVDCRVSAIPCRKDFQKITIRFLDKQDGVKKLTELRLSPRQSSLLSEAMGRDQGLILVTGPTGSGKTTTLYALLNSVNSENINIQTVEDPIEYEIEGLNQTQTDAINKLDFSEGLRRLMRADPDVILIGECRDEETATAAINAALTGHLVLTTLHANDCLRAVSRLISMGVPPFLLADSLALTQAQRLVRRLCTFCKRPTPITPEVRAIYDANRIPIRSDILHIYAKNGCSECNETGYSGRMALMELCAIDNTLADLISRNVPQGEMRRVAFRNGMLTLYQEGLNQVLAGMTSLDEIACLSYTAIDADQIDTPPAGKIVGMPVEAGDAQELEAAAE